MMQKDLLGTPLNPSSVHWYGRQAKNLLISARESAAKFFSVKKEELFFTSGATESINLFLRALPQGHLITTSIEHSAIHQTVLDLEKKGMEVSYLEVGAWGAPMPADIEKAIRPQTKAIVLSLANGETGVLLNLEEINRIALKHNIPLFLDIVAFIGKEPFKKLDGIKGFAASGHKIHGPKGVGLLYVSKDVKLPPLLTGGPQENGFRAGTENLLGILGFSAALNILERSQSQITAHITKLKSILEERLLQIQGAKINGEGPRVSNTTNISFSEIDGETLLMLADQAGLAISHGSACSSGALEPSRVLTNMGLGYKRARSSVRFSISRMNTEDEILKAAQIASKIVKSLHEI